MRKIFKAHIRLIRPQQWLKNVFVLAPLFFGQRLLDPVASAAALWATAIFCLLASAIYVFNDIQDREADRAHMRKRNRPLVTGEVTVVGAWVLIAVLVSLSVVLMWYAALPQEFGVILIVYAVLNVVYSLGLKHIDLVELFIVASGFVLRLIGGGVVIKVPLSSWIIVCTALVALLMVTGKRRGDLAQGNDPSGHRRALEKYDTHYLDQVLAALAGATIVSYLLFCVSEYATAKFGPYVLLTAVFVAFGVLRFLQVVTIGQGGDSPTTLVVKDAVMRYTLLSWLATFFVILYASR